MRRAELTILVIRIDLTIDGVTVADTIATGEIRCRSLFEELPLLLPLLGLACQYHTGKNGAQAYICCRELHPSGVD